jgi:glycosyltransferase involved in cell wall biosynthesis
VIHPRSIMHETLSKLKQLSERGILFPKRAGRSKICPIRMPLTGHSIVAERRFRVLAICSHPVQYAAPLFRRMAKHPRLDLLVAYCMLRGAEAGHDPEFGATVQWDVPLLDGYTWVQVSNKGSGDESFFGLNNPALWSLIRDGKFDAIFCYTGYVRASFWIARVQAWFSGAAFIFGTDATTLNSMDGKRWKRPIKRAFWPFLYRLATQVIVPSTGTRELMLSLGVPEKRISFTPYPVDNDWWLQESAKVNRSEVRASWRIPPEAPVILYCAKLQPWKRPQDLLLAFAKGAAKDSYLVIAGEGPLRREMEREAKNLGIVERTRFLGFVNQSQLPGVYTASDVLVLPSSYEAFGVVVSEASLCGCAVVASDRVGSAMDLIAPVSPGLIYPCGDIQALSAILSALSSDGDRCRALGFAARARMTTWSPEDTVAGAVQAVEAATHRGYVAKL